MGISERSVAMNMIAGYCSLQNAAAALDSQGVIGDYYVIAGPVFKDHLGSDIRRIPAPACDHNIYLDMRTDNIIVQRVSKDALSHDGCNFDCFGVDANLRKE